MREEAEGEREREKTSTLLFFIETKKDALFPPPPFSRDVNGRKGGALASCGVYHRMYIADNTPLGIFHRWTLFCNGPATARANGASQRALTVLEWEAHTIGPWRVLEWDRGMYGSQSEPDHFGWIVSVAAM